MPPLWPNTPATWERKAAHVRSADRLPGMLPGAWPPIALVDTHGMLRYTRAVFPNTGGVFVDLPDPLMEREGGHADDPDNP